eukprot:TRINITY_DN17238_c0_g1_i1.p1 TRINITY_DN17238_c0_g1~~TRINITY_DN17238_c0_g1_i1.p1  ORF type:complete len:129 (-),score=19.31 TRINITY_DN17238_c0_g1_i1:186-572(-)
MADEHLREIEIRLNVRAAAAAAIEEVIAAKLLLPAAAVQVGGDVAVSELGAGGDGVERAEVEGASGPLLVAVRYTGVIEEGAEGELTEGEEAVVPQGPRGAVRAVLHSGEPFGLCVVHAEGVVDVQGG